MYLKIASASPSVAKPVGMVNGFPLGCHINRSQTQRAMATVVSHMRDLQATLNAPQRSALEYDEETELQQRDEQSQRLSKKAEVVMSLLDTELHRLEKGEIKLSSRQLGSASAHANEIKRILEDLPWRYEYAVMRQKLMSMEFRHLCSDQSNLPLMEYPYQPIKICARVTDVVEDKTSLKTRKRALYQSLREGYESPTAQSATEMAAMNHRYYLERLPAAVPKHLLPRLQGLNAKYLSSGTELNSFKGSKESGGVLIMGCDLVRNVDLKGSSHTSHLLATYLQAWKVEHDGEEQVAVMLRHYAGSCHTSRFEDKKDHFLGTRGLMRSLCEQMVMNTMIMVSLDFVESLHKLDLRAIRDGNLEALCNLWRYLLIGATKDSRASGFPRTIVVAIDSIEWLETEDRENFTKVINFFRALCDEMNGAQLLGGDLQLQYVLVHSGFSTLLDSPHATEKIAICPFDEVFDQADDKVVTFLCEEDPAADAHERNSAPESSTQRRRGGDDELDECGMQPSQGAPGSLDKGKRATYLDKPDTKQLRLLAGKPIGAVAGFSMGYLLQPWQLKLAVGIVISRITKLCANLNATSMPEYERRQVEFITVQEDYSRKLQDLQPKLLALLEAEFDSASDYHKDRMGAMHKKIIDDLDKLHKRSEFVMLRRWMMRIEYIHSSSDESRQPRMEYPEHYLQMGSLCDSVDPAVSEEHYSVWRETLQNCLWRDFARQAASGVHSPAAVASMDHKDCVKIPEGIEDKVERENLGRLVNRYCSKPSALHHFRLSHVSKGLLIMGCSLRRGSDRQSWSHTSYLFGTYTRRINKSWEEEGYPATVLRHYSGYRLKSKDDTKKKMLSGVRGLIRSLCEQLISDNQLKLSFQFVNAMNKYDKNGLLEGDHRLLCGLFRELVIDAVNDSKICDHTRIIIVAIDEIQWFERREEKEEFFYFVDFLRALVDEMNLADRGRYVGLKYILVNRGFSKLLGRPHPREHVEICSFEDTAVRAQEIQDRKAEADEEAPTERRKAKPKRQETKSSGT